MVAMQKKLLIGILLDSYQIPNWAYKMIEQIVAGDYAQIVICIVKDASSLCEKDPMPGNIFDRVFYTAMRKLDSKLYKCEPDAFEIRQLQLFMPNIPYIMVKPMRKHSMEYFSDEDCKKIEDYNLDVLIKLGFGDLRGRGIHCAKYGVWGYQLGDNRRIQGEAAGLWEVIEGRGATGSSLKILTDNGDDEKTLCRSVVQASQFSIRRNTNNNYWKIMINFPRKLRELHGCGEESFFLRIQQDNQHPFIYSSKVYGLPKKIEWIEITLRYLIRIIYWKIRRYFYYEQYILLYSPNRGRKFSSELSSYIRMIPPKDQFWADPFIVYDNGLYYVFIEEVTGESNKGHISYFTIDKNGNNSVPKKIIERPYHMSYPFVFDYNDEYYMIPETGANKTIDLYKSVGFPEKWEMIITLMEDIEAYDVTLIKYIEKWWLFANVRENEEASSLDELCLFYSDDLLSGVWTPHMLNPVVCDVTSARPAGKIFIHNGNLYRPSQNSSLMYGYGVKINHIVTLTETEYKEECVNAIEPLWDKNIIAVHTWNVANDITIIDGLIRKSRFPAAIFRRIRKLY